MACPSGRGGASEPAPETTRDSSGDTPPRNRRRVAAGVSPAASVGIPLYGKNRSSAASPVEEIFVGTITSRAFGGSPRRSFESTVLFDSKDRAIPSPSTLAPIPHPSIGRRSAAPLLLRSEPSTLAGGSGGQRLLRPNRSPPPTTARPENANISRISSRFALPRPTAFPYILRASNDPLLRHAARDPSSLPTCCTAFAQRSIERLGPAHHFVERTREYSVNETLF
jgi:hypothetical protein